MMSARAEQDEAEDDLSRMKPSETGKVQGVIAWSSLLFAVLQSVCSFFVALDGLRLVIGVGALASVAEAGEQWDRLHTDWVRVPMVALAVAGALLTLTVPLHVRHLRSRPSARWRQRPLTSRKIGMERVQLYCRWLRWFWSQWKRYRIGIPFIGSEYSPLCRSLDGRGLTIFLQIWAQRPRAFAE